MNEYWNSIRKTRWMEEIVRATEILDEIQEILSDINTKLSLTPIAG